MKPFISLLLIVALLSSGCSLFSSSNLDKAKTQVVTLVNATDEYASTTGKLIAPYKTGVYPLPANVSQEEFGRLDALQAQIQDATAILKFVLGLFEPVPETPVAPQ